MAKLDSLKGIGDTQIARLEKPGSRALTLF